MFTLDIRIGIAIAGSAPPYLDRIVAAEESEWKGGRMRYAERSDLTAGEFCCVT